VVRSPLSSNRSQLTHLCQQMDGLSLAASSRFL